MFKLSLTLIFCLNIFSPVYNICVSCLQINSSRDPRILNGADANLKMSRYQVSIRLRYLEYDYFGHGHVCGGSLISKNVVLSAAHCFTDDGTDALLPEQSFIAVMGTLSLLDYNENTLIFDIRRIIIPENFNFATLEADIALIILKGKVPSKHPIVRKVILNEGPVNTDTMCQVTGWGHGDKEVLSAKLKFAYQPFINLDVCRDKSVFGSQVLDGMVCAGYLKGETQIRGGDSGGPLVCRGIQVGIVSFRSSNNFGPGVYTDIAHYKKWILRQVAKHNAALPKFASVRHRVTSLNAFFMGF